MPLVGFIFDGLGVDSSIEGFGYGKGLIEDLKVRNYAEHLLQAADAVGGDETLEFSVGKLINF